MTKKAGALPKLAKGLLVMDRDGDCWCTACDSFGWSVIWGTPVAYGPDKVTHCPHCGAEFAGHAEIDCCLSDLVTGGYE